MKEKFDLPEFQPNEHLWDKLEAEKDLDKQLSRELQHLPLSTPKQDAWAGIEAALDNQRAVFPYWANVAAVLLVMGLAYLFFWYGQGGSASFERDYLLTNIDSNLEIPFEVPKIDPEVSLKTEPIVEKSIMRISEENAAEIKETIVLEELEVPELSMPILLPAEEPLISQEDNKDGPAYQEVKQSFHEVAVSWGINDKIKINTAYSNKNKLLGSEKELSEVGKTPGKFVLRFSKEQ